MDALQFYAERIIQLEEKLNKLRTKKNILSGLRLGSILLLLMILYFFWNAGIIYLLVAIVILMAIFTRLLYKDLTNRALIKHTQHLVEINKDEVKAINHDYYQFDDGEKLKPKDHYYALDMDILGHASLFQFINRTTSAMGADNLAAWLLSGAHANGIIQRQEAVKELGKKITWNQELIAIGKETLIQTETRDRLLNWLNAPTIFSQFRHWKWLRYFLPAVILSIVAATIADLLTMNVLYLSLLAFAILAFQLNKFIGPLHEQLSKMVDEIDALSTSVAAIETEKFNAPYLSALQLQIKKNQETTASTNIKQLKKILDRLDIRYNIVISFPLNILLLWNLQQALDLEQWKKQHSSDVNTWFEVLASFEALISFATIHFNNPSWCFPRLREDHFYLHATELGHPLIPEGKRVNNTVDIASKMKIMLVTGSNMAGKSTYLRSVGVNMVLAMAGAPVCATEFEFSPVQLLSSMRIADNLEESTSTFYAELKKLKTIIEKVNQHEKVFVLLDEILRGTNSADRHSGSVALIKQMIRKQAAGIIATHDLALAEMEKDFPNEILNYHFDVQVSGEELYFDYSLKPGVCQSMNASILMKKIGIEL
ncbi:MAG: hypothetical protein ABIY51_15365 [Ferruginibacter sp.]